MTKPNPFITSIFLSFCFLFLNVVRSTAQVKIGVLGGIYQSKTSLYLQSDDTDFIINAKGLRRLSMVVPVEITVKDWYSILLEPAYWEEGILLFKRMNAGEDFMYAKNSLNNFSLPISSKFNMNIKDYTLYGQIGAYASFTASAKVSTWTEFSSADVESLDFKEEELSRLDYGVVAGAGIEKQIFNDTKINLKLLYHVGLKDIDLSESNKIFNEGYAIYMGILFPLGK